MRWAVVVFPGSNCDEDAAAAVHVDGQDEVDLVWHTHHDLSSYDAIILPGGFSYGDYLRSGAIARFSPVMSAVRDEAKAGKLILGICNGFQVLTEAGLLPGALTRNTHLQFRCELVDLVVENTASPFTTGYKPGETIRVPIAHGEGRFHADDSVVANLRSTSQIAFTYAKDVNGSVANIAGVLNDRGNVLGLMPHPERAVKKWMGSDDGQRLFDSMRRYVSELPTRRKGGVSIG